MNWSSLAHLLDDITDDKFLYEQVRLYVLDKDTPIPSGYEFVPVGPAVEVIIGACLQSGAVAGLLIPKA